MDGWPDGAAWSSADYARADLSGVTMPRLGGCARLDLANIEGTIFPGFESSFLWGGAVRVRGTAASLPDGWKQSNGFLDRTTPFSGIWVTPPNCTY